ncbi:MAG: tetratricopeptide repeat protein, partial [Limisphaerales bacterium]
MLLSILGIAVSKFVVPDACGEGGWFSRDLLAGGDAAVWVAPDVDFAAEMRRMNLAPSRFEAQLVGGTYSSQAMDAESADLAAALKNRKVPAARIAEIVEAHQKERKKLADFARRLDEYRQQSRFSADSQANPTAESNSKPPEMPQFDPVAGLPEEFADYFTGAIAWHNPALPDKRLARDSWERLLELPPGERRYKSVWAAFMLGKSWEEKDPDKAAAYFTQARDLAKHHFVDSLGLAAASLGLEARLRLKQKQYEPAIELYLAQLGAGDDTAIESLRIASCEALQAQPIALMPLAKNPRTQRTLTTYLVSLGPIRHYTLGDSGDFDDNADSARRTPALHWLQAVEKAEVRDTETAEKLALLAYQNEEPKTARRWIERAPGSPVAAWVRAKLLIRDGKVEQAESLLNRLTASYPLVPHNPTNRIAPESLKDTLWVHGSSWPERHLLGELGAVRLSRREYVRALDAFLNSGFWKDAAYVAERVLSVQELKAYVDGSWPAVSSLQQAAEEEKYGADEASPAVLRKNIRYLLGRRLT